MNSIIKRLIVLMLGATMLFTCACTPTEKPSNNKNNQQLEEESVVYNYDSGINYNGKCLSFIDGVKTEYSILVPNNAETRIIKVANEIKDYAVQITGATLKIINENNYNSKDKVISLGNTSAFNETKIDISGIKNDGYIIKTVGDNIFINSNMARGVEYGGYTFLERFLGVRWLTVNQTYIPIKEKVEVYECEIVEEPNFEMRYYMTGGGWKSSIQDKERTFINHMRFLDDTGEEWCNDFGAVHNTSDSHNVGGGTGYLRKYDVDPSDPNGGLLKDTHPEYFTDYTNTAAASHDICFSNGIDEQGNIKEGQSVASLIVENIKNSLKKDTDHKIKYFMFGHSDFSNAICHCITCDERREQIKESGLYLVLANAIIRNVNEWLLKEQGRTVTLVIFAYHQSYVPPVERQADGTYKPLSLTSGLTCAADKNLHVRIAPINANYTYSFVSNRQDETQLFAINGWKAVAHTFLIWDYTVNFENYLLYFSSLHYLKENLHFYKDELNATYVMNQSSNTAENMWNDDLKAYVASRLYWNFNWDVNYLIDEYLSLVYGSGAVAVKEVITTFEDVHAEHRNANEAFLRFYDETYDNSNSKEKQELEAKKNALFENSIGGGVFKEPHKYISIYALEKMINTLDAAIENIQRNGDSVENSETIKNINRVKVTPMYMVLLSYEQYYGYNEKVKLAYAKELFSLMESLGLTKIGEGDANLLSNIKKSYGV